MQSVQELIPYLEQLSFCAGLGVGMIVAVLVYLAWARD